MKKSIAFVGICILVVGMSFVLIHLYRDGTGGNPPINPAVGVSFTDTDPDRLEIGGNITITRAVDESDITHYVLYWVRIHRQRVVQQLLKSIKRVPI